MKIFHVTVDAYLEAESLQAALRRFGEYHVQLAEVRGTSAEADLPPIYLRAMVRFKPVDEVPEVPTF